MGAIIHSRTWYFSLLRILLLAGVGWWLLKASGLAHAEQPVSKEWPRTDFTRSVIDLNEIESGGPAKDGIPAIDKPRFVSIAEAEEWLGAKEPVIVVSFAQEGRAYPLQILIYHEIVNDIVGDLPLTVTFCPLCNSSIVYRRLVKGRLLDFGTTGKLRKSDMVMYDRQTESWWQQFTGKGIVGEMAGVELARFPSSIVAFEDFNRSYPDGLVLSRETGHRRPYGRNPYRGYDRIGSTPFLFFDPLDKRLPPMERVLNISTGDLHRIYPFSSLREQVVINDKVGDIPVGIFIRKGTLSVLDKKEISDSRRVPAVTAWDRRLDRRILHFEPRDTGISDRETGSRWNLLGQAVAGPLKGRQLTPVDSGVHFAFAWLAFRPDSEIYLTK